VISQAHSLVVQDIGEYWKDKNFIGHDSGGWHTQNGTEIAELYAEKLEDGLARYCGQFTLGLTSTNGCKILDTKITYLNNNAIKTYNAWLGTFNRYSDHYLYEFKDGTHVALRSGAGQWSMIENKIMYSVMIDINGYQKPNQIGKDIFYFAIRTDNSGIVPLNYSGIDGAFIGQKSNTIYQGIENYNIETQKDCTKSGMGHSCAYAIMHNGWKFPKNYHSKVN